METITESELLSYRVSLYSFAYSLCKNTADAEDLVQDTIIKAITYKDKFEIGTNLKAWLFTILRNEWFSKLRKQKRIVEDVDGLLAAKLIASENQFTSVEAKQTIEHIRYLPKKLREALIAVAIFGGQYEEAAANLGVSVGTVKSRVSRARDALEKGTYQDITEEEFDTPEEIVEDVDNTKWYDTIRILFVDKELDVSEIAAKINLSKLEIIEAISNMKLKRRKPNNVNR